MKKLLTLIFFFIYANSFATQYYISATGSDANNGTSTSTPWLTTTKVNSVSKVAGDIFSFHGGDTFYGNLIINASGSSGNPITFNSYGTGHATISGFNSTAISWTNLGGNIWESNAASTLSTCNMVVINGVNTPNGRSPQTGWYTIGSATSNSVTSSSFNSSVTNWTGAEAVIRKNNWIFDRVTVTSAAGATINFTNPDSYVAQTGWGVFIQNDVRTLTYQNAWYYNPSTKKIRIFSTSSPTNVQVATVADLVTIQYFNYITFDGIDFQGANNSFFNTGSIKHVTIQNCNMNYAGVYGILGQSITDDKPASATGCSFNNNTINHVNNNSIQLSSEYGSVIISNNSIHNNGVIVGMSKSDDGNCYTIKTDTATSTITYNVIDSSGYIGVGFEGTGSNVSYNKISNFCLIKQDGGAIYTSKGETGKIISYNTILNGVGNASGTAYPDLFGNGIYLDNQPSGGTNGTQVLNNNIDSMSNAGIYMHNPKNSIIRNNTVYFSAYCQLVVQNDDSSLTTSGLNIKNNIFFSRSATPFAARYYSMHNDLATWGTLDSNYYARPIAENTTVLDILPRGDGGTETKMNLAMWQTFSGQDAHSHKSPVTITNVNQLFFAYNYSGADSTIIIPSGTWVDVTGASYNTGSTVLHAYTSIILISTGTNLPPIANAGTNVNITLPTNSFTQVGSGSDPDGSIASYLWTKFSGGAATIVSPNSATTVINGLAAGNYVFQLRVTDNLGATATDTMSAVVNSSPPPNLPPVVNAGGSKIITLPVSSLTQSGSATDPDGTIAGYLWTQSGSNPVPATIGSPTSAVTTISSMAIPGVYAFTLTATDNLGATGSQSITVTVNAVIPVPPIAHAGVDQSITWPTNSVTLSGSATAGTGTIASYLWTKISGGIGTITNPNTASTTVTGLDIGTYLFQLTVTDNSGFQGKDTMQVTVSKGSASLSYTTVSVPYNAAPQSIGIVTSPVGLATNTTYNGVGSSPINAASYATISNIADAAHWNSTPITGTFTITPLAGTFTASNTSVQYDSLLHTIAVSTSNPAITYTITGAPQRYKNVYAVTVHNTNTNFSVPNANVTLTITAGIAPLLVWNPATPQTYPYALDGAVLNAGDAKGGVYHYTPLAGFIPSAGSLQLKVDFIPTDTNLAPIIGTTRTITINKGTDVMTASDTIQYADGNPKPITVTTLHGGAVVITYDGLTTIAPSTVGDHPFSAVYSDANWQATTITGTLHILSNTAIIKITNFANRVYTGSPINVTVTSAYPFTLVYTPSNHTDVNNNIRVIATINDGIHTGADTAIMSIIKATPTGTWGAISPQTYIYTVQSGILNASTPTAGTWAYNVSVGDTLVPGTYNLIGTFSPTDASNYNSITLTNSITVNKGSAVINISGTLKQYNGLTQFITATTTPPNLDSLATTYTGAHKDAGSYPFTTRLFSNLYTASNVSGTLTISQGSYTLSWATPVAIQSGTPLSATQYNPTSSIPVTFTFNYPIGTVLPTGVTVLVATAHPIDSVNYPVQTISVSISVYGNPMQKYFIKHGKLFPVNY